MLIHIGDSSATLTPFGSVGSASHSAEADRNEATVHGPNAIKTAWRWICGIGWPVTETAQKKPPAEVPPRLPAAGRALLPHRWLMLAQIKFPRLT